MEISLSFHYEDLTQEKLIQYIEQYLENNGLNEEYMIIPFANNFVAFRVYTNQDVTEHIKQTFERYIPFAYDLVIHCYKEEAS